jgi:hypothetical protein
MSPVGLDVIDPERDPDLFGLVLIDTLDEVGFQCPRMGNDLDPRVALCNVRQTAGVVIVAMTQYDTVQPPQIRAEDPSIVRKSSSLPCVEENPLPASLHEGRKSVLSHENDT